MKKIIFSLFIAISTLFGYESIEYAQALQKAKDEKKILIMILKTQYCPWCQKLINTVLEDKDVKETIQKDYIITILDRDADKFPDKFYSKLVPTTFFIDADKEDEIDMIIGYVRIGEFQRKLKEVTQLQNSNEEK